VHEEGCSEHCIYKGQKIHSTNEAADLVIQKAPDVNPKALLIKKIEASRNLGTL
jgi:hypothetical protein